VSRSFKLLLLASVRTFPSVFDQSFRISFQTQIWEDCCNRPDDVYIKYGNCLHQIDRPDDHPPGPNARRLYMKITCSGRTTVRTSRQHRLDAALKQERSSAKFLEFRSHSCPSGRPMTTVQTAPNFIKPDAHLSP